MKSKKKIKSGSVRVEPNVLQEAKDLCKKKGVLISFYVNEALKDKNTKEKSLQYENV